MAVPCQSVAGPPFQYWLGQLELKKLVSDW
jgi:hypothetical protein